MHETSKSLIRRSYDKRFTARWLMGDGIDIGSGDDPISNYGQLFPLIRTVRNWDVGDGDAMHMEGVKDASYDFVHSSHCLEHIVDPNLAMKNWVRICKPGGHLVIMVPDEDLYEQGVWPSTFNVDHKWSFTIGKAQSWCPQSVNVVDLLKPLLNQVEVLKIELLDTGYFYGMERFDQTYTMLGKSAIEIVLRKVTP